MDKRLSEKDLKMLLNVLENAKKAERKMVAKREEKRWADFEFPLTLANCLAKLTKDDLSTIRLNLEIKGASAFKKQELVDALERRLPVALPILLKNMDDTRYKIMKHIADRGGQAFLPLESHQLDYFKNRGLIFTGTYKGKKTMAMPQEVLEAYKKMDHTPYRETIRRNSEWIKLTQGMLYYYGVLGLSQLEELLKYYTGTNLQMEEYVSVIEDSVSFYQEIRIDAMGLSNIRVWDAERVKNEHQFRPDLLFYPFNKTQLLRAGEPGFVDRHPSYEAFVEFVRRNYIISKEEADSLVEECVYAIQIGESTNRILEFLQSQLEIDELELMKGFMHHIVMLHNNTRQWFIKGYTPMELSEKTNKASYSLSADKAEIVDFVTRKKVGRNDPCPCGSGKKFKKCCGG